MTHQSGDNKIYTNRAKIHSIGDQSTVKKKKIFDPTFMIGHTQIVTGFKMLSMSW